MHKFSSQIIVKVKFYGYIWLKTLCVHTRVHVRKIQHFFYVIMFINSWITYVMFTWMWSKTNIMFTDQKYLSDEKLKT